VGDEERGGSTRPPERFPEATGPFQWPTGVGSRLKHSRASTAVQVIAAVASRSVVLTLGRRAPVWPATVEHPKPARVSWRRTRWWGAWGALQSCRWPVARSRDCRASTRRPAPVSMCEIARRLGPLRRGCAIGHTYGGSGSYASLLW